MTEPVDRKDLETVELVRGAQAGDEAARDLLFERYSGRVHAIARRRMGRDLRRHMDSLDITQEALTHAARAIQDYEPRESSTLMRWLAKIVKHRIASSAKYHAAERRTKDREIAIGAGPAGSRGFEPADAGATPSVCIRRAEQREIIGDCLRELPESHRRLISLRDYHELSWKDVADKTGAASPDSARMMHERARLQFVKLLHARGVL